MGKKRTAKVFFRRLFFPSRTTVALIRVLRLSLPFLSLSVKSEPSEGVSSLELNSAPERDMLRMEPLYSVPLMTKEQVIPYTWLRLSPRLFWLKSSVLLACLAASCVSYALDLGADNKNDADDAVMNET